MKDNFDTILYIIIALIAFVISAIGKKKKKPEPSENDQSVFNTLINDEIPVYKEFEKIFNIQDAVVEKEPVTKPQSKNIEKIHIPEGRARLIEKNSLLTKSYVSSVHVQENNEIFNHAITNNDLTHDDETEKNIEEFDLRNAIVYSEILNRKKY